MLEMAKMVITDSITNAFVTTILRVGFCIVDSSERFDLISAAILNSIRVIVSSQGAEYFLLCSAAVAFAVVDAVLGCCSLGWIDGCFSFVSLLIYGNIKKNCPIHINKWRSCDR